MKHSLHIAAVLLVLSACNKAVMEPQKMGAITLSLSSDREVVVSTKADEVDHSDFLVDIYGTTLVGQDYSLETPYIYSEMPEQVTIPYGYYYVSAQNCTQEDAEKGFGQIWYSGVSERVDVVSNTPAEVTVMCKMNNAKVTMTIDESFFEDFRDVTAEITATRTVSLTEEDAATPTDVYFNAPADGVLLTYVVYGTLKSTGMELKYQNPQPALLLQPAKWAKVTIMSNHNGIIGPDVTVDGSMGGDTFIESIDPETGDSVVDGTAALPSILVSTQIDDAVVEDCVIDIY